MAYGDGGNGSSSAGPWRVGDPNPNRYWAPDGGVTSAQQLHVATDRTAVFDHTRFERDTQEARPDLLGLLRKPCLEHVLDPETYAEFDNGIRFECKTCGEHVVMPPLPGGLVAFRVAAFMVALLGSEEPSAELLEEYLDLKAELAEDFEAFEDALSLMATADKLLKGRLAA